MQNDFTKQYPVGPYRVGVVDETRNVVHIYAESEYPKSHCIAEVRERGFKGQLLPTAQLFSAAPDLYEAAKLLAAWDRGDDDPGLISRACSMARLGIRKVEGTK